MKPTTLAAVVTVTLALGVVVALGLAGGSGGAALDATWTSDTGAGIAANHHAVAVADGRVYAPISGADGTSDCALRALSAGNGTPLWSHGVPAANCTVHSVADPTVADADGDGSREVLAATTEREVTALDPGSGAVRSRFRLADYGYTKPVVADLSPAPGRETVAVDVTGTVFVFGSNGTTLWRAALDEYVWAQPTVADFDADDEPELLVAGRAGDAVLFAGDGAVEWTRTVAADDAITWGTHGQADDDGALEAVLSTVDGDVVALDGRDGSVEWRENVGGFAAVHALGDGDGDGAPEVYAAGADGTVRAFDAASGATEWETEVVAERVQMMPPPNLGDLDGDGGAELLAAGNDGSVTLIDSATGDVASTYARDVPIFTHATLADVDGDGAAEAFVMYADGRVVRLDVAPAGGPE